jgi:hypothetical protein
LGSRDKDGRQADILANLERSFRESLRLAKVHAIPSAYAIVVDRCGEPMANPANKRTLSDGAAREFSRAFVAWLENQSQAHAHATLEACVTAMVSDSRFQGQYLVFRTLSEFATWWADPEHAMLDAFVPYYLDQGFPIFGVTVFRDQA